LPDWWETKYLGGTGAVTGLNSSSSVDGNGLTLLQDYLQGNNPTDYYSQNGGTITPNVTVTGGNGQSAPQATFLPQPLQVSVIGPGSNPLTNAPVTFSAVGSSGGQFSQSLGGEASSTLTVTSDSMGTASIYYAGPDTPGSTNTIQATAGTVATTFTETTEISDGTVASCSGITQAVGNANGQIVVDWNNNATNATFILVQQSIDDVNWVTIASISSNLTNYTATETDPNQNYYFGVIAGKP
jgi:hypothetical protein